MDAAAIRMTGNVAKVLESPSAAPTPAGGQSTEGSEQKVAEAAPLKSAAVQKMVEQVQQRLNTMNVSLNFEVYGKNGEKIAVTVTEKDTGRVIREIPPKEIQNLQAEIEELAGLLFSERV